MRCKHCKDKFTPIHFNAKYCFKAECQKVWLDNAKAKQWVKEKAKRKEKLETVQDLMKKAQKVFNTWIRKHISAWKPIRVSNRNREAYRRRATD